MLARAPAAAAEQVQQQVLAGIRSEEAGGGSDGGKTYELRQLQQQAAFLAEQMAALHQVRLMCLCHVAGGSSTCALCRSGFVKGSSC